MAHPAQTSINRIDLTGYVVVDDFFGAPYIDADDWTYTEPGTYFPTALVESHRDGNVAATSRRIPNLDAARVVVKDDPTPS